MDSLDVACVGNAMVDTFLYVHDESEFFKLDKVHNLLNITAGAKVMVDDAHFSLGGNACNVAVGISKLGFKTGLIAELGDDDFSEKIAKGMEGSGVSREFIKHTPNTPSTFSMVLHALGDRIIFARHVKRDHDISLENLNTKWIYLTSLGLEWKLLYSRVRDFVNYKKIKLAFNPGTEQIKEGPESFMDILKITDILFVNKEEAEIILYGKMPEKMDEDVHNMLFRIQRMGPKIICMTDGENGSYGINEEGEFIQTGCAKSTIVERTGAGDAYSTGFLSAILSGKSLKEALEWGAVSSASVIEHIGAQVGLMNREELENRLKL